MALQDNLLSFQIKETVFLSSDKAGIAELKELELLPDVQIIEGPADISITGCLHLQGKYEPSRNATETQEGGTDTLISALHFTPFQLEENQTSDFFYAPEQVLAHRIPINVSIPLSRIKELGEIYAIVDSFDYQLDAANQLQIQAELKLAGISLHNEEDDQPPPLAKEEAWEFVHVANDYDDPDFQPATLDDIERKLAELEQEIEWRHGPQAPVQSFPTPYDQQDMEPNDDDDLAPNEDEDMEPDDDDGATTNYDDEPEPDYEEEMEADQGDDYEENNYDDEETDTQYGDVSYTRIDADSDSPDRYSLQEASDTEEQEWEEAAEEAEVDEAAYDAAYEAEEIMAALEADAPYEDEAEAVSAPVPHESKEMKVAISGKPAKEPEGPLNITSIFSQAKRAQEKQGSPQAESASDTADKEHVSPQDSATLEAVGNLTAVVRNNQERFSKMRLCIIQRNETLETISSRYSLPVSRIIEVNNLTSDRIVEGQILYIPQ